ncbi:MaoC family dehydratase [Salegentibacter salarius]|uniref:Dehydratase n=1 Tax=Salegentibacter salarius TaxID=435906 RepID=A0A2N0U588_9FLAO|nr:MaoC family dehydratase [Salegentibacter salarius]OEY73954.1 dehydratase [Salegentibacter salarius]PKD22154.1 dehydratase [Salegentibacter salarius]SLJ86314.1 Acyl dehydratase [Salegentibacter salarius]
MKPSIMGNYYEDFEIGAVIKHQLSKTIFESDNNLFSLLTMNHHPVHLNVNYCKDEKYGEILVVGTLVFSLVVGITVPDISGKAIANLNYEEINHLGPVFIGDTIYASTTVVDKRESKSNTNAGIVYVETVGMNQKEEKVISFKRNVLIKKQEAL